MKNPKLRFKQASAQPFIDTKSYSLGDVSEYKKTLIKKDESLYVGNEHILPNFRGINREIRCNLKGKYFCNNDILFGNIRPYLKKVWLSDTSGIASPDVLIFSAKQLIISSYLKCILSSQRFFNHVAQGYKGSKMPRGDKNQILNFKIQLPCLEEQQKIASFFSTLDEKISLAERKIEATEKLKKGLMQKLFNQEIRFVNTEGLSYPDWKPESLKDISEIKTGPFGSVLHAEDYVDDGIPIITTEHFKSGFISETISEIPQVSEKDYKRLHSYVLKTDDIVFSRVGSVDVNALVKPAQNGWLFSGRVLRVRVNKNHCPSFLHFALDTNEIRKDIRSRAVGLTMPSINTKILEETKVYLPCLEEQIKISNFLSVLDQKIILAKKYVTQIKLLKQGFMQQMFV